MHVCPPKKFVLLTPRFGDAKGRRNVKIRNLAKQGPLSVVRNRSVKCQVQAAIPLTLQPLLFWRKQGFFPKKNKGCPACGTPKILGKGRKNAQKSKENRKTKKARKSKKARIGGSGSCDKKCNSCAQGLRFRGPGTTA